MDTIHYKITFKYNDDSEEISWTYSLDKALEAKKYGDINSEVVRVTIEAKERGERTCLYI